MAVGPRLGDRPGREGRWDPRGRDATPRVSWAGRREGPEPRRGRDLARRHSAKKRVPRQLGEPPARTPGLGARLRALWASGRLTEFYATVQDELTPKVQEHLRRRYRLTVEDAEDCVAQALEGFVERQNGDRGSIQYPQAYIWRSADAATVDLFRSRGRQRQAVEDVRRERVSSGRMKRPLRHRADGNAPATSEWVPISEPSATVLIEALVEDVNADLSWAVEVVDAALRRLRPALRRVIQHLLTHGFDYNASQAPQDLAMSPAAFRANKSKAYAELRRTIPTVMTEQGIERHAPRLPDVGFQPDKDFPSLDDEADE